MSTITEEEFDKLVYRTIRIDLTDGTVLIFPITAEEKQRLISRLRDFSQGMEEGDGSGFISFEIYPDRQVYINKAFMLRLIFCFDGPSGDIHYMYRDNFGALEDDEKIEGDFAIIRDEELYLPQAIIKLSALVGYQDSDTLFFGSISPGDLAGFDLEIEESSLECRTMLELIDDDGENNFIPLRHIMCMEVDTNIVRYDEENE